jgi:N-acetylmuramoyl-L-alanine amidase
MQKAVVRGTQLEDRGVKRARFWVLRDAAMPAVLIESGFMSNPAEARKIYSAAWRKQLAQSIVSGIENYKKVVEP